MKETTRILKNVIVISLAFLLEFSAFAGIANLQSTLNNDADLGSIGTASLAVIYGALIISSLFLPTYVMDMLGLKHTMMASLCGYLLYTAANFYPSWYTLMPTAVILGLCGAPLWSAKCAYVTTAGQKYSKLVGRTEEAVVAQFFGIFFCFFQMTQVVGNLISSLVLSDIVNTGIKFEARHNASYISQTCGRYDCQEVDFNEDDEAKDPALAYTLMAIYTCCGGASILILWLFLDPMQMTESKSTKEASGLTDLALASIKHFRQDRRQQCIAWITMYSGFKQAFMTGDFTKSFISCPLGISWIGFVLMAYGATDAVCSLSFGRLSNLIGKNTARGFLIGLAIGLDMFLCTTMLLWDPQPVVTLADGTQETRWLPFFWIPMFYGMSDAVIQTQINAIYGAFFSDNQDAAFSNYRFFESVGFIFPFAYQSFLCVTTKLYIQICVLIVAAVFYVICEALEFDRQEKESDESKELVGSENASYDGPSPFVKTGNGNVPI